MTNLVKGSICEFNESYRFPILFFKLSLSMMTYRIRMSQDLDLEIWGLGHIKNMFYGHLRMSVLLQWKK
uniref:Uncharacterized protein n=1 Tax=Lepeophtheirus salmonis TaxID=72036 RepID=A0A0K2UCT1_LEPSM